MTKPLLAPALALLLAALAPQAAVAQAPVPQARPAHLSSTVPPPASPTASRALKALEQLAASGSPRAMFELGRRYETGVGVPADTKRAFDHYCDAAVGGYSVAAYALARLYLTGQGVKPDSARAAAWVDKAVAGGHTYARELIAGLPKVKPATAECRTAVEEPPPVPAVTALAPPREIQRIVDKLAPRYKLDPKLVLAVIQAESGFRTDAVSPRNARGLMQLIPATAERFGVKNAFHAEENIRGGMMYLRWLLSYYEGDVALALAAYNAGEGTVDRHKGIPPYAETRDYVAKILAIYPRQRHPYDRTLVKKTSRAVSSKEVAALR